MSNSGYFSGNRSEQNITLCYICIQPGGVYKKTPECNHTFHHNCLDKWYRTCFNNNHELSCPLCNRNVLSTEHLNVYTYRDVKLFNPKNTDLLYYNIECYEDYKIATINSNSTSNNPSDIIISLDESVKDDIIRYVEEELECINISSVEDSESNTHSPLRQYIEIQGYTWATLIYLMKTGHIRRERLYNE